jgi:hypothetical protein
VVPAGGEGVGQAAEMESMLALAENVYVNLLRPGFEPSVLGLRVKYSTAVPLPLAMKTSIQV